MRSTRVLPILLVLAACSGEPASSKPAPELAMVDPTVQRNAELVRKHTEIWTLMGLSPSATIELNHTVESVNAQMDKNRREHPDLYAQAKDVKRAAAEPTHDEYIAAHKQRFDFLGISQPTQAELLAAAEFVWTALHDPNVPADKKQVAETIKAMMTELKGPPPCCDDNLFRRAAK